MDFFIYLDFCKLFELKVWENFMFSLKELEHRKLGWKVLILKYDLVKWQSWQDLAGNFHT